ncbi:hypothetical protein MKW94_025314 [Papaver nudicaule]|uniref:Uncharacterized protein n=1 Tax=Papaver nudicaule TaxID=74823 RepID=A0AA41SC82_PAPNU|nr:hypothetical protein [Papaver nudicaule]
MTILRSHSRLYLRTPPPSPISNARGLKSAAVNDEILADYLEKTLQVPDLTLPESYGLPNNKNENNHSHRHHIPFEINYSALKSRDEDSIRQLFQSVTELGVFRLTGHGVSAEELRATISEADLVFRSAIKKKKKPNLSINLGSRKVIREEFFWFGEGNEMDATLAAQMGNERYTLLSQKLDDIYDQLDAVAENVGQILFENMNVEPELEKRTDVQERESVLCYYKFSKTHRLNNDDGNELQRQLFDEEEKKNGNLSKAHAFSLYLYVGDQKFHVHTERGSLSCKACSSTIVVTIKKQLEEWSHGRLKCVPGEPIVDRNIHVNPSYAIEFMYSPSSSFLSYNSNNRRMDYISIFDQILIVITAALLYSLISYISSKL